MSIIKIKDFHAGTTLRFSFVLNDYSSDEFECFFVLQNGKKNERIFTYPRQNELHVYDVNVNAERTAELEPGIYKVTLVVRSLPESLSQITHYLDCESVKVKEDVLSSVTTDLSTENERMLIDIKKAISNLVNDGYASVSMNGKTFQKVDLKTLNEMKVEYEAKVVSDKRKEELKKFGRTNRNQLKIIYSNQ